MSSICVPHASRRRSKWYVRMKRRKHLVVWIALAVTLVVVLGVAVAKYFRQQHSEEEKSWLGDQKVIISPKFKSDR